MKRRQIDYGLLLALLLPIFAIMPLLTHAGLPNTADGPVHLMRQVELNQAWQQGNVYPRWGTDLALGHGMPIFSYAPPLLYQLTQLFHLVGLPLDEAMKGVLVLDFLLYSAGMFLFARRIFGPGPALLAAAVYLYAPYRLREAYIQGNYGQFTGLAFYPLIFWACHGLISEGRPRYLIAAALSLAGLLFSHNISTMLFAPIFAAYLFLLLILTVWPEGSADEKADTQSALTARSGRFIRRLMPPLLRTAAGVLLGLGLAAIFWLPAFGERNEIKLEGIVQGFFDFRENFISLSEFFSPPLPLDLAAINPEFPLSLGLPQILGAGLGMLSLLYLIIRRTGQTRASIRAQRASFTHSRLPHSIFFSGFLLLYGFLAVPASQPVWEAVPLLELTEFPWRMLGPAIFCASFLAALPLSLLADQLGALKPKTATLIARSSLLIGIFITIALNAYYLYPSQFIVWGTPAPADAFAYEVTSGAIGTTSTGEFLPRSAQQHPQPETLWPDYEAGRPPQKLDPDSLPGGATVEIISHLAESDSLRISTPEPFVATLRTLYWPGWQLYLNGEPTDFSVTEMTGLIQTRIPAGQHLLTLHLESTPLRTVGRWLTLGSLLILLGLAAITLVRRSHEPADQSTRVPTSASAATSPAFFAVAVGLLIVSYLASRPLAPLFTLQSDPNLPEPADQVLRADFGDQIRLVGMDELPEEIDLTDGERADLTATVYWRALEDLDRNYAVFLHLDAPNGQTLATVDEVHPENIPTRNWPPGLYLRNPLQLEIPAGIPPIRYDLTVGVYNRQTGQRLLVEPTPATAFKLGSVWLTRSPPPIPGEPLAHFGQHITLLEAEYPTDQSVVLYWQTQQPIREDYSIFVHLLDQAGNLLGQIDGVPYDGLYPLVNWRPGQVIVDRRQLAPTLELGDQLDAIAIGIYDPVTGNRLPARDTHGESLPNDSLLLPVAP